MQRRHLRAPAFSSLAGAVALGCLAAIANPGALAQNPPTALPAFPVEGIDLDLIQRAWDDPEQNRGKLQQRPGYRQIAYRSDTVITLDLRFGLATAVRLHPDDKIITSVFSNPAAFEASINNRHQNVFFLRPKEAGVDSSLHVTSTNQRLYVFYVRSHDFDAPNTTDLLVDVVIRAARPQRVARNAPAGPHARTPGSEIAPGTGPSGAQRPAPTAADLAVTDWTRQRATLDALATNQLNIPTTEYFGNIDAPHFDPSQLYLDIDAYGSTRKAIDAIGPIRVYRDELWTYIDYGQKAHGMQQYPSATLLEDDTETPVPTQVAGAARQILIVKAVGDIVLRSGPHVVCLYLRRGPAKPLLAPQPDEQPISTPLLQAPSPVGTVVPERDYRPARLIIAHAEASIITQAIGDVPYAGIERGPDAHQHTVYGLAFEFAVNVCRELSGQGYACTVSRH